ncbi:MAG: hypothetical protein ACLUN5_02150 [Oscillospiraceae bacterium]
MKHTRIKMICIVIGMIPLLSTVVNAVSMGGFSLLHAAGDAETGNFLKVPRCALQKQSLKNILQKS